jgi:hypothetical protein
MVCKDYAPIKKYLLLSNNHNSMYGDCWALFWGHRESKGGYTSDLRVAHRFTEEEVKKYQDETDIPIPIDALGISEDYESEETINKNISVLIEKGTLNQLLDLNLKPLKFGKDYCPNCGEEL